MENDKNERNITYFRVELAEPKVFHIFEDVRRDRCAMFAELVAVIVAEWKRKGAFVRGVATLPRPLRH